METIIGKEYNGNKATTISRKSCQRWDSQYPHNHSFTDPEYFPDTSLFEANNYCRNPDGNIQGPWCFTSDPNVQWETCGIDICHGWSYRSLFLIINNINNNNNNLTNNTDCPQCFIEYFTIYL